MYPGLNELEPERTMQENDIVRLPKFGMTIDFPRNSGMPVHTISISCLEYLNSQSLKLNSPCLHRLHPFTSITMISDDNFHTISFDADWVNSGELFASCDLSFRNGGIENSALTPSTFTPVNQEWQAGYDSHGMCVIAWALFETVRRSVSCGAICLQIVDAVWV